MIGGGNAGRREASVTPADRDSAVEAEEAALRILNGAAQSAAGLQRRLRRRGFTEEAAERATAAMLRFGYIDDTALAQSIAGRRQRTGRGRVRVAAELRARGIDDQAIAATLGDIDPDAERTSALELGRRLAARASRDIADRQSRQRLGGVLQRRGFDTDTVVWVLRELEREG